MGKGETGGGRRGETEGERERVRQRQEKLRREEGGGGGKEGGGGDRGEGEAERRREGVKKREKYWRQSPEPPSGTVVRQTDSDVSIGHCVVSDRKLACAILIGHKTLSYDEVEVCLLP